MSTITGIQTQQNDAERVNVFVDGNFAFGITLLQAMARGLKEGAAITEEEIESLRVVDLADRAFSAALNFLSFRPRSRKEIENYFRRKNVDADAAAAAIERLTRLGLVNDEEFARFWVENRQSFRPRGIRALRSEMRQKGLDPDAIEGVLETLDDEEDTAYSVAAKKARSYAALDDRLFFQRMVAFLQRRGFAYGIAAQAARRVRAESGDEDVLE